jgi:hypothetical protein
MNIRGAIDQKEDLNPEQILQIFLWIGSKGDVIILKNDGARIDKKITALISSTMDRFETIRHDSLSISDAIKHVTNQYLRQ